VLHDNHHAFVGNLIAFLYGVPHAPALHPLCFAVDDDVANAAYDDVFKLHFNTCMQLG
jgi:hypothetical protein